jgi:hypothetical protein
MRIDAVQGEGGRRSNGVDRRRALPEPRIAAMNEADPSPWDASGEARRAVRAMALGALLATAILAARSVAERRGRRP